MAKIPPNCWGKDPMIAAMAAQNQERRSRRNRVRAEAMRRVNELGGTITTGKIKRRQDRLMRERLREEIRKWKSDR